MYRMKTIYLCGPINGRTDADCKSWREEAKGLWGGSTLDPICRDYRGREDCCAAEIVHGDLEDIQNSDAFLVYFDKPSVGTSMEVFYAKHVLELPIVVVSVTDTPLSPWLVYHSDHIAKTIPEAVGKLNQLLGVS